MFFIFNILDVIQTGVNHNVCGNTPAVLDMQDTEVTLSVEGNVLFTTTDLLNDAASISASCPSTIGSTSLTFESFDINPVTGAVILEISGISSCDEKELSLNIEKGGHYGYTNSFKLFGYDLGNETGVTTGNPDLSIVLIDKNSIVDTYGLQTKTFSKFTTYQKPFTNKTLVYNLVGTTGEITYTNVDSTDGIGGGQNAIVCSITGLNIKQTIIVRDKDCVIYDTCESTQEVTQAVWFPPVNKSVYSDKNCDTACTSILENNSIELNLDYAAVTVFKINGEANWLFSPNTPSPTLLQQFVYELYDYNGQVIETETIDVTTYYSDYILNPSSITPTTFNFNLPVFGDVVVKVKYQIKIVEEGDFVFNSYFLANPIIVECVTTQGYNSCNYWKVVNGSECGAFKVLNCALSNGTLNIYQLQADKTFSNILEQDIDAMDSLDITLESDGVYTFVFVLKADNAVEETYVVFNYCNFKTCYFEFLKKVLCTDICEDCNKKGYYDFNSFSLNAQVFLALMNAENGFNYLYTAIDLAKIEELYTIKTFIDRLNEYCANNCGCSTCK